MKFDKNSKIANFCYFWQKWQKSDKIMGFIKSSNFGPNFGPPKNGVKMDPPKNSGQKKGGIILPRPKGCLVYLQKIGIFQK